MQSLAEKNHPSSMSHFSPSANKHAGLYHTSLSSMNIYAAFPLLDPSLPHCIDWNEFLDVFYSF